MKNVNGVWSATLGILAVVLAVGVYKLYERTGPVQGDLVITGRTPAPAYTPRHYEPPASAGEPSVHDIPAVEVRSTPPVPAQLVIHIAGAVKKPGVYRLAPDSRADDALKAAGGAKPDANLDAINLAAHLEDGKQLYVPTRKEHPDGGAPEQTALAQPGGAQRPAHGGSSGHAAKLTSPSQGTININTASAEELERLPGVGPSYAQRILQFRKENGRFTNPDQLMDISGIGAKKFETMRPFVRIK